MHVGTKVEIRAIAPHIGAEVVGLDLSKPLDADVVAQVRAALCRHLVLFFLDQDLSPEEQAAFARQFGEVTPAHPVIPSLEGHPEVLPIDGRVDRASWWHTDVTFLNTPPLGSILHMRECPKVGGDTMWVSLQAAYDALAEPVRALCDTLIAWHHDPWFAADVDARGGYEWDGCWNEKLYPVSHPVVRTHPETGRNALYLSGSWLWRFREMTEEESRPLLEFLYAHAARPEFTCRFHWTPGALALLDNRCTQHFAINDYAGHRRVLHRVMFAGERPIGPALR